MQIGLGIGIGHNSRRGGGPSGPSYDADAELYINATGELFPDALNTLVLGIKAAGLWDDHIGSIKKAIGVPNLAASLVDLRNPSFNGTPVNNPTHSATEGWGFTAASSQYIDSAWNALVADSKGAQDSVHVGFRIMAGGTGYPSMAYSNPSWLGAQVFADGIQRFLINDGTNLQSASNPAFPGHYIGTRTGATARASYKNGTLLVSSTTASNGTPGYNLFIGARNNAGTPDNFLTGRITAWHAGAALDATQQATIETLFDAYATAAGEA